jgi:hypothetical protein
VSTKTAPTCFLTQVDVEDLKNDLKFVIETTGLKEDYDKWLKEKPFLNSNFK